MLKYKPSLRYCLLGMLVLLIVVGLYGVQVVRNLAEPVNINSTQQTLITVRSGMSTHEIAEELYRHRLIKSVAFFRLVAKVEGLEKSLQAAKYSFSPSMSVREMVQMLATGKTAYYRLTIPEGFTIDQIAALLAESQLADATKFKTAAKTTLPLQDLIVSADVIYPSEGFAFPDTYYISQGVTESQLLQMMISQFRNQFTPELEALAAQSGLSLREVITLASLVEKEAQVEAERSIIAGVFLNRLRLGMPLQSCATIQYILGYPKPELTIQDTQLISPYNTYLHPGLPPGPIANPGLASIKAVLYPAKTDNLYFVADKNGSHHFSQTYAQHLAAIARVNAQ